MSNADDVADSSLDDESDGSFDVPEGVNVVLAANIVAAAVFGYVGATDAALIVLGGNVVAAIFLAAFAYLASTSGGNR